MKSKKIRYPKNVCFLDIETHKTNLRIKEDSKVAVVGLKFYKYKKSKYKHVGYKYYLENELKNLGRFLTGFNGLIVGYNTYRFDYIVLKKYFSFKKIIPKSVDLLFLLRSFNSSYRGLSLNDVCRLNFKIGKTIKGRAIPKLWLLGEKEKVIKYNENDCYLTFRLWEKMIFEGEIDLTKWQWNEGRDTKIILNALENKYLIGKFPCTYFLWDREKNNTEYFSFQDLKFEMKIHKYPNGIGDLEEQYAMWKDRIKNRRFQSKAKHKLAEIRLERIRLKMVETPLRSKYWPFAKINRFINFPIYKSVSMNSQLF